MMVPSIACDLVIPHDPGEMGRKGGGREERREQWRKEQRDGGRERKRSKTAIAVLFDNMTVPLEIAVVSLSITPGQRTYQVACRGCRVTVGEGETVAVETENSGMRTALPSHNT